MSAEGTLNGTLKLSGEKVLVYVAGKSGCQASTIIVDLSISRDTLNKIIKRLVDGGLVEWQGSKKAGVYYVKKLK